MAHLVPHHDDSASSSTASCSASVPYASSSTASCSVSVPYAYSSTASCSASVPYVHYDIFINLCNYNYCSRDVNTFATKLSSFFRSVELHVFVDNPNLRELHNKIPPAIENAILASSVHIAILPPNFAQSKCCLDELVLMIKSSAESKTTTIPVFYYAKPSELRRTGKDNNGPYAQALCNYEKENLYDTETIKQWRDALHHVAEISGFVVDETHRDEEEIMNKIIESVFQDFPYGPRYDVFLNHRGPDVKETFASNLYNSLVSCGFRVFLDEQEFVRGLKLTPQIEVAIQFAHVNIAIFSPRYAESSWCLDELNLMVRSRNTILPVFYEVKLSDLQCPEGGLYGEALLNQKSNDRYDPQTLQDWRNALSQVGKLPGHELDGNKDDLLAKIVETVKKNLAKRFEVIRSSDLQNVLKSVLKENAVKVTVNRETTVTKQAVSCEEIVKKQAVQTRQNFGTETRQRVFLPLLFNSGTQTRQNSSPVPLPNDREPERGVDLLESSIRDLSFTNPSDVSRLPAVSKVKTRPIILHQSLLFLPEGCMSAILSFTTPRDVSRLAAVSKVFRAAAYSDAVWNTFLPPQCDEILPRAVIPLQFASCRELYFRLCNSILIDGGRKLFWLDRSTGKIGYMLSARALLISWGDDERYWRWVCRDDSRFDELAELLNVCWLKVWGTMDRRLLSADTEYRVVFVLKLNARSLGFNKLPIRFSVNTSEVEGMEREQLLTVEMKGDGRWMEVIAGEFRVRAEEDIDDDSSHIRFEMKEVQSLRWKTGLLVEGVKIEPISN